VPGTTSSIELNSRIKTPRDRGPSALLLFAIHTDERTCREVSQNQGNKGNLPTRLPRKKNQCNHYHALPPHPREEGATPGRHKELRRSAKNRHERIIFDNKGKIDLKKPSAKATGISNCKEGNEKRKSVPVNRRLNRRQNGVTGGSYEDGRKQRKRNGGKSNPHSGGLIHALKKANTEKTSEPEGAVLFKLLKGGRREV